MADPFAKDELERLRDEFPTLREEVRGKPSFISTMQRRHRHLEK